jgi:hypothetical protein
LNGEAVTGHTIFVLVGVGLGGLVVVVLAMGLLFRPVERWVRRYIFGDREGMF